MFSHLTTAVCYCQFNDQMSSYLASQVSPRSHMACAIPSCVIAAMWSDQQMVKSYLKQYTYMRVILVSPAQL